MDNSPTVPQRCDAPEESIHMLSQLIRKPGVQGCIALTSPDMCVVWSEGVALASPERLSKIVHFVQDMLRVSCQHVENFEHGDEANLLRIRTRKYELIITPSMYLDI